MKLIINYIDYKIKFFIRQLNLQMSAVVYASFTTKLCNIVLSFNYLSICLKNELEYVGKEYLKHF